MENLIYHISTEWKELSVTDVIHNITIGGHKLWVGVYYGNVTNKPLPSAGNTNRSSKNVVKMLAP